MATLEILPDPCGDCGACCRHLGRPPFVPIPGYDESFDRLLRERPDLAAELDADFARREANGGPWDEDAPCLWYDGATGRCRHYEHRPDICRDFDPGSEECLEARGRWAIPGPHPPPPPEGE